MRKTTPALLVHVDQSYTRHVPEIHATISQLLDTAGWQSSPTETPHLADLTYAPGKTSPLATQGSEAVAWDGLDHKEPTWSSELFCEDPLSDASMDYILATAFLLSGRHEHQSNIVRNKFGVPSKGLEPWGLTEQPIVLHMARRLRNRLIKLGCFSPPRASWPNGKFWAMCLTHDCDRIYKFDVKSRLRDAFAVGINPQERLARYAKLAYAAVIGRFTADPYWSSWMEWLTFERDMNLPSTYYVATCSEHGNGVFGDVSYYASDPKIKHAVRRCLDNGFEIGLHSSIGCWQRPSGFAEETARFVEVFGQAPHGFRGHCWSLNPENQEESLCLAHDSGGLLYDTSIGMNEIAGYRRGTAYPYRPFDRVSKQFAGLIEIPPTIMDASLIVDGCVERGLETFRRLAETTKQCGGVFVLDWHSDSLSSGFQLNIARRLLPILQNLAADSSCWVTTPARVTKWCVQERWSI